MPKTPMMSADGRDVEVRGERVAQGRRGTAAARGSAPIPVCAHERGAMIGACGARVKRGVRVRDDGERRSR